MAPRRRLNSLSIRRAGSLPYTYTGNETRDDTDVDPSLRGVGANGVRTTAASRDGVRGSNRTAIEARKRNHRSRHRPRRSAGGGHESLRLPDRRKARKGPFGDG